MLLKKLLLTAALTLGLSLPAMSSEIIPGSYNDSATTQPDRDTVYDCWLYIPGWGWIYIC